MSLLTPRFELALKNARLPEGMDRLSVPISALPQTEVTRVLEALSVLGLDYTTEDLCNAWTVAYSPDNGRTLWGPYVGQDPDEKGIAGLLIGGNFQPLQDLEDVTSVTLADGGRFELEWRVGSEYFSVPVRVSRDFDPSLADLRKALQAGDGSQLTPSVIFYPRLSALDVGEYDVVGIFQYKGYRGLTKGLIIRIDGINWRYAGNTETSKVLSIVGMHEITPLKPAKLIVHSHKTTDQGHPMAVVSLIPMMDLVDLDLSFNLPAAEPLTLAAVDPDVETIDVVDLTATEEPIQKRATKKSRKAQ